MRRKETVQAKTLPETKARSLLAPELCRGIWLPFWCTPQSKTVLFSSNHPWGKNRTKGALVADNLNLW
jgi:hypothetical protein